MKEAQTRWTIEFLELMGGSESGIETIFVFDVFSSISLENVGSFP